MNDTKDKDTQKTLTLKPASTLKLTKTVESGKIRQNFARGGSKTVTVERRRTRNFSRDESGKMVEVQRAEAAAALSKEENEKLQDKIFADSTLTEDERTARIRALKMATEKQEAEEKAAQEHKLQQEAQAKQEEELREQEAKEAAIAEQEEIKPEIEIKEESLQSAKPAEEVKKENLQAPAATEESKPAAASPTKPKFKPKAYSEDTDDDAAEAERGKLALKENADKGKKIDVSRLRRGEPTRRAQKVNLVSVLGDDEEGTTGRTRSLASIRRAREKARRKEMGGQQKEKISREVVIPEVITVQELANRMAERAVDVIKELMKMGMIVTASQTLDADTAELITNEMGHKVKRVTEADVESVLLEQEDAQDQLISRNPVVTVMGHVDHGKTSLLDALRSTDVTAGEAGGITQHIGAYQVQMEGGEKITFLDTPGHQAFTAMRSRGARVTDIVVLVVAADDGIKEQTVEAINHAKAAEVPIIVAVNKIDKPGADPTRVVNELLEHGLVAEDLGGDIMVVPISAKQKTNLDKLEEAILLQAEVLELKANPDRVATGAIIEAKMDKGRGPVATFLVQRGTLNVGDIVVAGMSYGTVRALIGDKGNQLSEAGPSLPVEVLGLNEVPEAGEQFSVVQTERQAREIVEYRKKRALDIRTAAAAKSGTLEKLFSRAANEGPKELPIIVKADVHGSTEAIVGSLQKLANDEVNVKVIHAAAGGITESDISLAKTSGAIILGFNVRASAQARDLATREVVDIRYYSIIYNLIDDMKAILGGMLQPVIREQYLGSAEIRQIFKMSKAGKVAGCFVVDGTIKRGAGVRLLRDNIVIHEGKLKTLKRFKDDVKEVNSGYECGMAFENYDDIKENDVIEAFEMIEEKRELE